MLRHFRELAASNTDNFFSLPKSLFEQLPAQSLAVAITSGLQCDEDVDAALPLRDRAQVADLLPVADAGSAGQLVPLQQDSDEFLSFVEHKRMFFNPKASKIQATTDAVFFRISHATPNRMKRPTKNCDDVKPDDVVLRLYSVIEESSEQALVAQEPSQDLLVASLLSWWDEAHGPQFVQDCLEWRISPEVHITPRDLHAVGLSVWRCGIVLRIEWN